MKNMIKSFKSKIMLFSSALLIFQLVMLNGNNVYATLNTGISYDISGNTTVGSIISIAVNVSNVNDLYGGSIDFLYDPTLLQVQSITKGNIFNEKTVLTPLGENGQINNGKASFAITLRGNTAGLNARSGTIAIIKAKILKAGTVKLNTTNSNSGLSLTGNTVRVKLANSSATPIEHIATNKIITLNSPSDTAKLTSFTTDKASSQPVGSTVTFTAKSDASENALYKFFVYDSGKWVMVQDYSNSNTYKWTPSKVGNYKVRAWVKHKNSSASGDAYKDLSFTITEATTVNKATLTSFTTDKASSQPVGSTVTFTAKSDAGENALYKFFVYDSGKWVMVQDYSNSNTYKWTPSKVGNYKVRAWVKHKNSSASGDAYKDLSFTITE